MVINYQKIYEKLGYLFYAVASADKVVTTAEVERLKEMIQKLWLPAEPSTDEFGTDAAHYIWISFDYLMNEGVDADIAFDEFRRYYLEHKDHFPDEMRKNIKMTCREIAGAFRGPSKRELETLQDVEDLLQ